VSLAHAAGAFLVLAGLAILGGGVGFAWISLREREERAARLAGLSALLGALPFFAAAVLPAPLRVGVLVAVVALALAAAITWYLPIGTSREAEGRPTHRVDERDIMFARQRLVAGTREYAAYYAMRPENKKGDDRARALPGLLSPHAANAEPVAFAEADACFAVTEAMRDEVDGPVATTRRRIPSGEDSARIKREVLELGARHAGITALNPYHLYTHIGRGSGVWGDPVRLDHTWVIAFTVEMDHAVMRHAPAAPVVAESARRYVDSAKIAVEIASRIRARGYAARAHIDGNYRVIAPLVAMDAGLGTIGRMGLLITPDLGPRVRIGVVTTDLPLDPDLPGDDPSVTDFCTICKKCAVNCPSRSIPFGDREHVEGGLRWAIEPESCFRYWCAIGTDCGRCMTVCPYSHPDNLAHGLVRRAIRRSGAARRAALWADDLFYGRRPVSLIPPSPSPSRRERPGTGPHPSAK